MRVVAFGRGRGGSRGLVSSNQAARKANNNIQDWTVVASGRVLASREESSIFKVSDWHIPKDAPEGAVSATFGNHWAI